MALIRTNNIQPGRVRGRLTGDYKFSCVSARLVVDTVLKVTPTITGSIKMAHTAVPLSAGLF